MLLVFFYNQWLVLKFFQAKVSWLHPTIFENWLFICSHEVEDLGPGNVNSALLQADIKWHFSDRLRSWLILISRKGIQSPFCASPLEMPSALVPSQDTHQAIPLFWEILLGRVCSGIPGSTAPRASRLPEHQPFLTPQGKGVKPGSGWGHEHTYHRLCLESIQA